MFWHTNNPLLMFSNFEALRMPLYFFLSGFFFKQYDPKTFLIKKINNILIPFIAFIIIFDIWEAYYTQSLSLPCLLRLFIEPDFKHFTCDLPLWFLLCLFTTNLLFYSINYVAKNDLLMCSIIFVLFIGAFLLSQYNIRLSFWFDTAMSALPFFFFGYMVKKKNLLGRDMPMWKNLTMATVFIGVSYITYFIQPSYILFIVNEFNGSVILALINNIFFVFGILLLCKTIRWLPILSYIGRYSIILLIFHYPVMEYGERFIGRIFDIHVNGLMWNLMIEFFICIALIPICKKISTLYHSTKAINKIISERRRCEISIIDTVSLY